MRVSCGGGVIFLFLASLCAARPCLLEDFEHNNNANSCQIIITPNPVYSTRYLVLFLYHPAVDPPHARPACPIWILSPVHLSSLRSTGHPVPSAFASVISNLVPRTRNCDFSGSIDAKSGMVSVYRLLSVVGRSRLIDVGSNSTLAFALSIFFR